MRSVSAKELVVLGTIPVVSVNFLSVVVVAVVVVRARKDSMQSRIVRAVAVNMILVERNLDH